jgi:hypothetical protein
MERDSESAAEPEQAVPEQAVPEQAVPEQAVPEQAVPEQAVPEQAVPEQAVTGDARVDEALAELADLGGRPVDEHPAVFERVHRGLTEALGALDSSAEDLSGASGTPSTPRT